MSLLGQGQAIVVAIFGDSYLETCISSKTGDIFSSGTIVDQDLLGFFSAFDRFFGHQYRLWAGKPACIDNLFICHEIQLLF